MTQHLALACLRRVDGHGHGQAAADQHGGLRRANFTFQQAAAGVKCREYSERYTMYAVNSPPKNMISVTRNTHMPRLPASCCCSMSSN